MSVEGAFFMEASGSESPPMSASGGGGGGEVGSPPAAAYSLPDPAVYLGGGGGGDQFSGGGNDQFSGVGSNDQFGGGGGGGNDQFSGGGDPFGGGGDPFGGGGDPFGGGGDQFGGLPQQQQQQQQGGDMAAAPYQPRPTDPYSLEEAAGILEAVRRQFEAAVRERADKEAAKATEVKRLAEEELDGFYDERTDEVARRQARSREQEEAFLKGVTASVEESASNPWARVCDLVDLKAPVLSVSTASARSGGGRGGGGSRSGGGGGGGGRKGSGSGSRRGSGAGGGMEEEDAFQATAKMRSLIIQMKADTAHDSTGDGAG